MVGPTSLLHAGKRTRPPPAGCSLRFLFILAIADEIAGASQEAIALLCRRALEPS
jgi:hypothetical protein